MVYHLFESVQCFRLELVVHFVSVCYSDVCVHVIEMHIRNTFRLLAFKSTIATASALLSHLISFSSNRPEKEGGGGGSSREKGHSLISDNEREPLCQFTSVI